LIDRSDSVDDSVVALVASPRDDILNFAQVNLKAKQPRDYYDEFLELLAIFLQAFLPGVFILCKRD